MRAFLSSVQGKVVGILQQQLLKRWGADVIEALHAEQVLLEGDRARYYPCPGGGDECPRDVYSSELEGYPWVAIHGGDTFCCPPVPLTDEDVRTWDISQGAWFDVLRRLFDVTTGTGGEVFPRAERLGRGRWRGVQREVLWLRDTTETAIAPLLLRRVQGKPTLAIASIRGGRRFATGLEEHFGPGELVEVVFLEDVLDIEDGAFVLRLAHEATPELPIVPAASAPYAVVVDAGGRRSVDESTYLELAASAKDYDLFLDLLAPVGAERFRACRRDGDAFVDGSLTHQQALAYAELMERGRPMRAAELDALNTFGTPQKQVEAARRVLDVKTGRTSWRSTQLLKGEETSANRYVFRPPQGVRWVLVQGLP